ncbi:NADH:flavin oxidoreductase/NADH oxidase [Alcaligenaceae bacterium]|nr:NADH:flavin oxidoreductase/NADH oxidase [Alcaligenaceae bacterium]
MSQLFTPLTIGQQTFSNRISVSPMCQYSATDGCATAWHQMHLGMLAGSGAGLVVLEATAVERAGRIAHGCLGLYSDANEFALANTLAFCRTAGSAKFGIQIGHSGRKGSSNAPWDGGKPLDDGQDPWRTFAPSTTDDASVIACVQSDLDRIKQAFVDAAVRAVRIGFDLIEVHAAHGYLLHQFLSPLSNHRTDQYGGSQQNRFRFPLEVFEAIRAVVPENVALGARITGSDWLEGGITVEEAVTFAQALEAKGCEYVDVTSGGVAIAPIPVGPGYQVAFASAVKQAVTMPVRTVGMIVTAQQAEEIIVSGAADAVAIGRGFIDNPHWAYEAAQVLGAQVSYPRQYARAAPNLWPGSSLKPR